MHDVVLTTEGCRYCLMCRHVCPVTRVTFNEATSPHGWALEIASVRRGQLTWNAETTDLLFQCADCGLCQSFCATDQPLPYAIVAARAEVVAAGHAPSSVLAVDEALRQWGNPYGAAPGGDTVLERAPAALFVGSSACQHVPNTIEAARTVLAAVDYDHTLVGLGRSSGYLAYTLGLHNTARTLAQATVDELRRVGCRTLIVLSPEHWHTFTTIYPLLGVPLPDDIEVVELTALMARLLDEERIALKPTALDLAYHDPCQTPRIPGRWRAPRRVLAALTTAPLHEGFWREQRAANCGASGGLPWTQPRLAVKLAHAALHDATRSGAPLIVTDAPGCLSHLQAHTNGQNVIVRGLYEIVAEHLAH